MNLPDYHFLPAPLWLITVLHVVTLTLHFAAMNFVFGGVLVLVFARVKDKWHDPTVRRFVAWLPSVMAATVTLGVAPLLFLQLVYGNQVYSASITSAWWWILIVAAVIVAYYLLYASAFSVAARPGRLSVFLAFALVALAYVSFIYSNVFSLTERPETIRNLYAADQSGWALNGDVGVWGLRWLHMVAGAVTVAGFFMTLLGRGNAAVRLLGRRVFLWGAIVASVIGIGYLVTLGDNLAPFMRSSAMGFLTVAIVLTLAALHLVWRGRFALSAVALFLSMTGMVSVRHVLRLTVLDGQFDPATIPVVPQWPVFIVFLVCFVLAVALIVYMLRLLSSSRMQAT